MSDTADKLAKAARAVFEIVWVDNNDDQQCTLKVEALAAALAEYDAAKEVREAERAIVAEAERLDHVDPYRITTAMSIAVRKRSTILADRKALEDSHGK